MKQLRLLLAEKLLGMALCTMPPGKEKDALAGFLKKYITIIIPAIDAGSFADYVKRNPDKIIK